MSTEDANQALKDLKKLEAEQLKKKLELEKLKAKIKSAEKNLRDEQELEEKVPIDQVTATSSEGMSAAEKEIFEAHRGSSTEKEEEKDQEKKSLEEKTKSKKDNSLEATVADETFGIPGHIPHENTLSMQDQQQILQMSQEPITQLYDQMKNIYDTSVAKGYVAANSAEQAVELQSAIERKLADVKAGNYQFESDRVAKAASVSLALKDKVSAMYVASKDNSQSDLYR